MANKDDDRNDSKNKKLVHKALEGAATERVSRFGSAVKEAQILF